MSTEAFQNPSSSTKRPLLLGEPKHTLAKSSSENGDNAVPRTCFSTVPSQSSKAASKIFEHLDKINSPKEKSSEPKLLPMSDRSPTKLSPSMLRGQALKSLEDVDSSKFLENPCYKNGNNLDVSSNQLILDASSQKHDNVKENCPSRVLAPCDNSSTVTNEVESTTERKDVMVKVKPAVSAASNTVVHPPEKKRPFEMSAHEYLELDDDDCSINGHVPGSFADGRVQVDKIAAANLEKPIASTEVKPPSSFALNEKSDSRTSDGVYTVAPGATGTVPKPVHTDKADKNNSDAEVPFRVPEILVSSSAAAAAPTSIFSTTSQVSNNLASQSSVSSMAPTANTNSGNNIAATSAVTTSNLFSSVSAPSFSAEPCSKFSVSSATTVTQVPENSPLELLGDKNKQDGGFANLSRTVLPGTSTTSAGTENSFVGVSAAASFPTATNQSGPSFSSGSGSGLCVQASPKLLFKCEPSTASTALTSGSSSLEFLNDRNKQGGSFGTVSSSLFSGTFATSASASSNSFGFSAAASMPTVTDQAPGSSLFSGGSGTGSGTHLSLLGQELRLPHRVHLFNLAHHLPVWCSIL
ncbi:PREDICTED: nuclear pore complex protein NUP1-like [Fragaria vesca subsp. vesca]|uniref:nuclear pore complex protein NUP1-like n=1 Tax=Fragaria vesca subsp. vesca TaxID=101020 RepID=UPI0002C3752E|nr:PREDICTED: nuclear pore complex protein NUP1-like [Fragaria vesca subsp. vesca]